MIIPHLEFDTYIDILTSTALFSSLGMVLTIIFSGNRRITISNRAYNIKKLATFIVGFSALLVSVFSSVFYFNYDVENIINTFGIVLNKYTSIDNLLSVHIIITQLYEFEISSHLATMIIYTIVEALIIIMTFIEAKMIFNSDISSPARTILAIPVVPFLILAPVSVILLFLIYETLLIYFQSIIKASIAIVSFYVIFYLMLSLFLYLVLDFDRTARPIKKAVNKKQNTYN